MNFNSGGGQRKSLFLNRKPSHQVFNIDSVSYSFAMERRKEKGDQGIKRGNLKPFWI